MEGIRDWDAKIEVLKELLNATAYIDITDAVYPADEDAELSHRVCDMFRKWRRHKPTSKYTPFFNALARRLGCAPEISGVRLVNSDIDGFIEVLPPQSQHVARQVLALRERLVSQEVRAANPLPSGDVAEASSGLGKPGRHQLALAKDSRFAPMQFFRESEVQSVREGIAAGKIDQKHYYLGPDATETWYDLIFSADYPTYDICKTGLRSLTKSPAWQAAMSDHLPSLVVMLAGGGAPSKDAVLLGSLLQYAKRQDTSLTYLMVDISPYMLWKSFRHLDRQLQTTPEGDRVDLGMISADILSLHERGSSLRSHGNVLFGMTGGTIGNVSEEAFFRSLNNMSEAGDYLILSADTIGTDNFDQVTARVSGKYDNDYMRRFISPAMRMLMHELDLNESLGDLYKQVSVSLTAGQEHGLSDVRGSMSVRISLQRPERDITLLSSTRYDKEQLVAFAREHGWSLVGETPSPLDENFVQFFLRKD